MFWGENSMDSWDQSKTGIKGKWFKFYFSFWLLVSPVTNFNYKWLLYSYFATVHNHTVLKGPVMFICRLEFYRVHHGLLNKIQTNRKAQFSQRNSSGWSLVPRKQQSAPDALLITSLWTKTFTPSTSHILFFSH